MNLNLTENELNDLINTWMAFTRFSDSVGFLLRKYNQSFTVTFIVRLNLI